MERSGVVIRKGTPEDSFALAVLRFRDVGRDPDAMKSEVVELSSAMARWMRDHENTTLCVVAVTDQEIVGMAWLAIVDRVPVIGNHDRRSGDIQSVFVLPEYRRRNIGRLLLNRLTGKAEQLGLSRVSLHSSGSALPFYSSVGFGPSPNLLQRTADD